MRLFPRLSLNRLRGASILDEVGEHVFTAPPFTPEVAASVGRISTRLAFRADERSRQLCEKEANGMSEREYEALAPLFAEWSRPRRVLEIGPGFGRSVVYFHKKQLWDDQAQIHLYDTDGKQTEYKQRHYQRPPQWPDVSSFCGNLRLLAQFLDYNRISGYRIFDAAQLPLSKLPGPYDLIYGFFSIGYHWSLEFYLDDLAPLIGERTILVCTLNKRFQMFSRLGEFSTRVLLCRDSKKKAPPLHLLVLSKSRLPEIGMTLESAFPGD
jgi:hypothetical protein